MAQEGEEDQKVRFRDNIKEISAVRSMAQLYRIAQDRRKWITSLF